MMSPSAVAAMRSKRMNEYLPLLMQRLTYCPESGIFIKSSGKIVGCPDKDGYLIIGCAGINWKSHRLAWAFVHGEFPSSIIDHRNGVKTDNRIDNLRIADELCNARNIIRARQDNISSGVLGVARVRKTDKWVAQIQSIGKKYYIGTFDTPEDAHKAYVDVKRVLHPGAYICQE